MENRWQDFKNFITKSNEIVPPRSVKDYEVILGFKKEDLVGKRVLDIGSHKYETFANELIVSGIDADVISLSPDFASKDGRVSNPENKERKSVAALGEQLPFKDESFDYIFDLGGPSIYSTTSKDIQNRTYEEARVLKKGGVCKFVITNEENKIKYEIIKTLIEFDDDPVLKGVTCSITPLGPRGMYRFELKKS